MIMEALRRAARNVLRSNSFAYRAGSHILNTLAIARREGPQMVRTLQRLANAHGSPSETIRFRNLMHPIAVRPGTVDVAVVIDNIIRDEYGRHRPKVSPHFMIDAGAFIGDVSAYYLSQYPALRVWALEPNAENFEIASANLSPYGERATLLPCALYKEPGLVKFSGDAAAGSIQEHGILVQAVTIPWVLASIPGGEVDILKIDIEGAEDEIFRSNPESWLPRVGLLIIELHSPDIEKTVLEALRRNNFSAVRYRSIWFCTNQQG